jgi:histidyl-tRNA synthetase
MGRKLGKAIAYASAREAKSVAIVGTKDLKMGKVTFRNMRTGEQELVARKELVNRLKSVT